MKFRTEGGSFSSHGKTKVSCGSRKLIECRRRSRKRRLRAFIEVRVWITLRERVLMHITAEPWPRFSIATLVIGLWMLWRRKQN